MICSRREFLGGSVCVAGAVLAGDVLAESGETKPPPNVVFILADDMGWTGPACYGSDLHETPNIDRLAQQGMRFTQAYSASPVCTPTRASIMTGKHPARLHMTIWHEAAVSRRESAGDKPLAPPLAEASLALEHTTMAEMFQAAGYQTAHIGKWHLGDAGYYPETQGFDVNIGGGFYGAPITYWYPYKGERTTGEGTREHRYVPGLPFGETGEYLTDRLTDEALTVLDRVHTSPFFLHMAYHNPHTPIEGKPELVAHYEQKIHEGMDHHNARYAAMVHSLDENIGRLLQKLEDLGVAGNTLVIFFSDNGGFDQVRDGKQVTSNAPLRSGKGSVYEGGIRVPLIVKWPGRTPANTRCETPVISTDFYPTLLEILGREHTPAGDPIDGVSLAPLLQDPAVALDRETLHWHYPHYYFNTGPVSAIREGDWKLLEYFEEGNLELYNLKEDLAESNDLAAQYPEIAGALRDKLKTWREAVDAQLPEKNL